MKSVLKSATVKRKAGQQGSGGQSSRPQAIPSQSSPQSKNSGSAAATSSATGSNAAAAAAAGSYADGDLAAAMAASMSESSVPLFSDEEALINGDMDAAIAASLEQEEKDRNRNKAYTEQASYFMIEEAQEEMAKRASIKSHEYDSDRWETVTTTRSRRSRSDKEGEFRSLGHGQLVGRSLSDLPTLQPHLHLPPLEKEICRHIFIDNSNIFYGLMSRNKGDKRIRLSVPIFSRLLELGPERTRLEDEGKEIHECKIGKRVVIGSSGPNQLWDQYAHAGYTCNKVPPGKEVTADSLLQVAALNLILAISDDPEQYGRHTIVIASGDGNTENVDASFVDVAERAAMKGCRVVVWSWQGCLSNQFRRKAARFPDERISMHFLDDYEESITYFAKALGAEEGGGGGAKGGGGGGHFYSGSGSGGGGGGSGGGEYDAFYPDTTGVRTALISPTLSPLPFLGVRDSTIFPTHLINPHAHSSNQAAAPIRSSEPFSYAGVTASAAISGGVRGGKRETYIERID